MNKGAPKIQQNNLMCYAFRTKALVWRYSQNDNGLNYQVLKKERSSCYFGFEIRRLRYFDEKQSINNLTSAIVLLFFVQIAQYMPQSKIKVGINNKIIFN